MGKRALKAKMRIKQRKDRDKTERILVTTRRMIKRLPKMMSLLGDHLTQYMERKIEFFLKLTAPHS